MLNFIEQIKNEINLDFQYPSNKGSINTNYSNIIQTSLEKIKYIDTKDFYSFLKYSMLAPIITTPFTEENKIILSFMEDIAYFLQSHVNNNDSLCSVIMPTYNRENTISEAIESVLNQNYENIELIIIDDNSTDNTSNIIKKYDNKKIKIIKNESHLGCSKSRNKGVFSAQGEYIFYLDSDNTWDSRYIKTMLGSFKYIKNSNALYCGQYLFNGNSKNPYAIRFASFNLSLLENRNYIDINCFAHTKKIFNEINGFDINLKRLIDYDFILRISKNYDIYSIPVILSNYFFNKANNTITNTEDLSNSLKILNQKKDSYHEKEKEITLSNNVSAIIPNYEAVNDLEECISSLWDAGCSEIIVIDNNSSYKTQQILKDWNTNNFIKLIQNRENFGFTYAINQGLKKINQNNDIILANNDSIYTKNSIFELQKYAYSIKDCAITVPRQILFPKTKTINTHVPYANPNNECDVNLSLHHNNIENINLFSNGKLIELNFAPFFCAYIKREIFNIVGELDAQHGRHYRSDRLYCNTVRLLYGKKIYYVPSSKVYHKLQQSTQKIKKDNYNQYDSIYKKNIWPDNLMNLLGYKRKLWELN